MMRDSNGYNRILDDMRKMFGNSRKHDYMRVKQRIKAVIRKSERCIKTERQAVHDRDRIMALQDLVRTFARGMVDIRNIPGFTLFEVRWIAEEAYGPLVNAGLDSSIEYVSFASEMGIQQNNIKLEILAMDGRTDLVMEDYRSAIIHQLFNLPGEFRLNFGYHVDLKTQSLFERREPYRKVCLDLIL